MLPYTKYTDGELVSFLQKGDASAFHEIYKRYWKLVYSVASTKLDSFTEGEEIVQEIFTDLWARRESVQITRSVKYYLAAAVKYQVMTVLARRKRQSTRDISPLYLVSDLSSSAHLEFKQLQEELESVVNELPGRCQVVYRLSREEGLSHKDISRTLNISEKTVESQITRALARIRRGLGDAAVSLFPFFL